MSDSFRMQKRYFTAQLGQFSQRPELHRAMIRDCEHYLQVLDEAGSVSGFKARVQQTGNMVSTAKAKVHDTFRNRAFIYQALGHEAKAEEDRMRLEIIESAKTHGELSEKLEDFNKTTTLGFDENRALNALEALFKALFQLCTDGSGSKDEGRNLANFKEYWKQITGADPKASWERFMTHGPYRDRLPFTDGQMALLEKKFREVSHG